MTSWHTELQDGRTYYVPQCDVCGLRYDEYGLYEDKEQAAADAVNDGWQTWVSDLSHRDWECRCPDHWVAHCETCGRIVSHSAAATLAEWMFDRDDDDMRVGSVPDLTAA